MRAPERSAGGLALDAVRAGYGGGPVLDGVSLEVPPGTLVGLIGPNGSGKTTVIRVASRALRPSAGTVRVAGVDPFAVSARAAARLVAVVPQDLAPAFPYSVLEMVLLGRSPHRGSPSAREDWAKVRWAMREADVAHLAERSFDELSGGERQRVVVAQALAQDAPVLLLDEPTTHLDVRHVVDALRCVRALASGAGTAVLAIFHDLNLASAFCDRIYALKDGRVIVAGAPEEVITADVVRELFGVDVEVTASRATSRPAVVVVPEKEGRLPPVVDEPFESESRVAPAAGRRGSAS